MDGDVVFTRETKRVEIDLRLRQVTWEINLAFANKQRTNDKIKFNRRSAFGKPISWPLELFSKELRVGGHLIPEPEPAKPGKQENFVAKGDPLARWKEKIDEAQKRSKKQQEDRDKTIITEVSTVVDDYESNKMIEDEVRNRRDEDDLVPEPEPAFDFQKMEEDRSRRIELARLCQTDDSRLLTQIFDSCPLQGATGLAAAFSEFFPWMVDAGNGQAAHIFWNGKEVYPQLQNHWAADRYRAEKLFVPVDRTNATFNAVVRLWKELNELAAERKRAITGYSCCLTLLYGQRPRQAAHIEHTCLRHDLDRRIVNKPSFDHAEDFKHDKSVNTAKKVLGFVKDQPEGLDEVDAYLNAWKRLAGKGRWWFIDKYSGREWIAVPCLWRHTDPTESSYLEHFSRCFAEEHYSIYHERSPPGFKELDPEAVFEIKASVLARKAACLHTTERSFQKVSEIVWLVLFKQTPDAAKKQYDQAVQALNMLKTESMFADELPADIITKEQQLLGVCKQFEERANLVFRAVSIIFERAPRKETEIELVLGAETEKSRVGNKSEVEKLRWKSLANDQVALDTYNMSRRVASLSGDAKEKLRERKRKEKAAQRLRANEKKQEDEVMERNDN